MRRETLRHRRLGRVGTVTVLLLATLAGVAAGSAAAADNNTITVTVPAAKQAVVTATGGAITEPPAGTDPTPGATVRGYWTGVKPVGTWHVWLMPAGIALGATEVGTAGRADFDVTLPEDLTPGDYYLELVKPPTDASGDVRVDGEYVVRPTLALTVVAAPIPSTSSTPTAGGASTSPVTRSTPRPGTSETPESSPSSSEPAALPDTGGADDAGLLYVSGLTARYRGAISPGDGTVTIEMTVRNAGTVTIVGSARAWVTGPFGHAMGTEQSLTLGTLAPGATQVLAFHVNGVGQGLRLVAHATLSPKPAGDADPATADQLHDITRDATVLAVPWSSLALLALLAGAGVAVTLVLRRRRPVHVPAGPAEVAA